MENRSFWRSLGGSLFNRRLLKCSSELISAPLGLREYYISSRDRARLLKSVPNPLSGLFGIGSEGDR